MKPETCDRGGAAELFHDSVRQPHQDLAAEMSKVDRCEAAGLLEANEAVESDLDASSAETADVVQSPVAAADAARSVTGRDRLSCATLGGG
jgi:hypothetical protein